MVTVGLVWGARSGDLAGVRLRNVPSYNRHRRPCRGRSRASAPSRPTSSMAACGTRWSMPPPGARAGSGAGLRIAAHRQRAQADHQGGGRRTAGIRRRRGAERAVLCRRRGGRGGAFPGAGIEQVRPFALRHRHRGAPRPARRARRLSARTAPTGRATSSASISSPAWPSARRTARSLRKSRAWPISPRIRQSFSRQSDPIAQRISLPVMGIGKQYWQKSEGEIDETFGIQISSRRSRAVAAAVRQPRCSTRAGQSLRGARPDPVKRGAEDPGHDRRGAGLHQGSRHRQMERVLL